MSPSDVRRQEVSSDARVANVDLKLEAVVIPVSDADRAKAFYGRLGWRLDADFRFENGFRVVQFTPPGSGCSVQFGTHITSAAPPTARSPRSATRTATAGCCRRSRPGFPGASTRRHLAPPATWRARFGVWRPPTACMRSASARQIRTGPTGTPSTWWRSRPGRSCRRERRRRRRPVGRQPLPIPSGW